MTKHTPGPWRVKHRHIHAEHDSDEMGGLGWELTGPPKPIRGDFARAADARLIASAPDLLTALTEMEAAVNASVSGTRTIDVPTWTRLLAQAQTAMQKARGES